MSSSSTTFATRWLQGCVAKVQHGSVAAYMIPTQLKEQEGSTQEVAPAIHDELQRGTEHVCTSAN